ncbi:flagellar biosynthesis protein FlhA [Buchnera aphidicola (Pemphigus obesinymphae)]|uniref:flagellar biosynthesis protein FlhA n=1 Tax=Buchnera aphidicola TaxID=9 RepID=UPI002236F629|nr:flagellar biosynthesis protein FlhA [Buchnera aphidicola]MCW5196482.1 flagellar biosynthesis protein FlhA [Buchnera aphidicola (Pemphigus obesinymphae)]
MININNFIKIIKNLKNTEWQALSGPVLILIILSMMVLPLPSLFLDIFFTFNIVLAIIILLVSMFTRQTLEFTAFPTVLLFSTLLRLALNVASTRVILLYGHTGAYSAGNVIKAFGHFLVGGNYAIGIVVFIILVIINFMVITKGASRIAEVGARFTLDGMPGKQMAIDADLNAGLIGEKEAKRRRIEVTREADFYGSMDGASKFVRGDAIAGIFIMIINILGGLVIGIVQHNMFFGKAIEVYTLLTIGDGLVAQIPALVISTAAGVMVTRVSTEENVGEQIISQLFYNPKVILLSGVVLGILGLVPGMPSVIFLSFTTVLFFLSGWLFSRNQNMNFFSLENGKSVVKDINRISEVSWNDVKIEDLIGIEIGNKLIPIVDVKKKGKLLYLIRGIRKRFAQEMGFLPPLVHIQNNSNLSSYSYRFLIKGVEIAVGEVYLNRVMAINSEDRSKTLDGKKIIEPVFDVPAFWININQIEEAKKKGFTIVNGSTVIATHLNYIMRRNMNQLFGRQQAQDLLNYLTKRMPKLIEDLVPNTINLTVFHKVLQNLLLENVSIRDMNTIIETLIEYASIKKNEIDVLTSLVRVSLGKFIIQNLFDNDKIQVIGLDVELENLLLQTFQNGNNSVEPGLADKLLNDMDAAIQYQKSIGVSPVLLVNNTLRTFLFQFFHDSFPELSVLSNMEVCDAKEIRMTSIIGKKN